MDINECEHSLNVFTILNMARLKVLSWHGYVVCLPILFHDLESAINNVPLYLGAFSLNLPTNLLIFFCYLLARHVYNIVFFPLLETRGTKRKPWFAFSDDNYYNLFLLFQ